MEGDIIMYIVNSNSNECDLERKDNYPPEIV